MEVFLWNITDMLGAAVAMKRPHCTKFIYCRSGSELPCQIFSDCVLNSLLYAMLVSLNLLQYFWYNRGLNI